VNVRAWLAELFAVYALVFFGTISATLSLVVFRADPVTAILFIGLTHGLTITLMVYATGHISGGHINPAVTIASLLLRKISLKDAFGYIVFQIIGAVLAAATHAIILPQGKEIYFGLNQPGELINKDPLTALVVESILTFFLVFVVLTTALHPKAPQSLAGVAIGLIIAVDHFVGIPLSGASMNPARTFGPALVSGNWSFHWIYWIGPIIGAAIAAAIYFYVITKKGLAET